MSTRDKLVNLGKRVATGAKKAAPTIAAGAKKAHGALVSYYGPEETPKKKATKKRTSNRGSTATIKVVHIHRVETAAPKRKRKRAADDDDDFFSSRGF